MCNVTYIQRIHTACVHVVHCMMYIAHVQVQHYGGHAYIYLMKHEHTYIQYNMDCSGWMDTSLKTTPFPAPSMYVYYTTFALGHLTKKNSVLFVSELERFHIDHVGNSNMYGGCAMGSFSSSFLSFIASSMLYSCIYITRMWYPVLVIVAPMNCPSLFSLC